MLFWQKVDIYPQSVSVFCCSPAKPGHPQNTQRRIWFHARWYNLWAQFRFLFWFSNEGTEGLKGSGAKVDLMWPLIWCPVWCGLCFRTSIHILVCLLLFTCAHVFVLSGVLQHVLSGDWTICACSVSANTATGAAPAPPSWLGVLPCSCPCCAPVIQLDVEETDSMRLLIIGPTGCGYHCWQ